MHASKLLELLLSIIPIVQSISQPCVLSDLAEMEPAIHRSLTEILDYEGDDFDQVFCLNFQTQVQDFQGRSHVVDLIPQGGEVIMIVTSIMQVLLLSLLFAKESYP